MHKRSSIGEVFMVVAICAIVGSTFCELMPGTQLTGYVAKSDMYGVLKGDGDNILTCFGVKSEYDCEECCGVHKFEAYNYPGICGCVQNNKKTHVAARTAKKNQ